MQCYTVTRAGGVVPGFAVSGDSKGREYVKLGSRRLFLHPGLAKNRWGVRLHSADLMRKPYTPGPSSPEIPDLELVQSDSEGLLLIYGREDFHSTLELDAANVEFLTTVEKRDTSGVLCGHQTWLLSKQTEPGDAVWCNYYRRVPRTRRKNFWSALLAPREPQFYCIPERFVLAKWNGRNVQVLDGVFA